MEKRLSTMIFIMVTLIVQLSFSQTHTYYFNNYTIREGLTGNFVRTVVRDTEGFVWIGTYSGLNRFDGYQFRVYKSLSLDSSSLTSNVINHLSIDSKNRLWIASFGVCIYNPVNDNFNRIPLQIARNQNVYDYETFFIMQDTQGIIWGCTNGYGLIFYDEELKCFRSYQLDKFNNSTFQQTLPKSVTCILQDGETSYWFCNYTHLYNLNTADKTLSVIANEIQGSELNPDKFQSLRIFNHSLDPDQLWISTWGHGIVNYKKSKHLFRSSVFETNIPSNVSNIVLDILPIRPGWLWAATNNGIKEFSEVDFRFGRTITDVVNRDPLVNVFINELFLDYDSILWIGSVKGLSNINPDKQLFIKKLLIPENSSIFIDDLEQKQLYVPKFYNERSLLIYNLNTYQQRTIPLPGADAIRAEPFNIIKDIDGNVWIGSTKGIYQYNPKSDILKLWNVEKDIGISNNQIYVVAMETDTLGNLWVLCQNMLLLRLEDSEKFDIIELARVTGTNQLLNATMICRSKGNGVLVYSNSIGIFFLDAATRTPKLLVNFNEKQNTLNATSMKTDKNFNIWLSTRNNGLIKIDRNNNINQWNYDSDGRIVSEQQSLVVDNKDRPWFIANNKLYMFNPQIESFLFFNEENGFPAIDEGTNLQKLSNGTIAFNIPSGTFVFNPDNVLQKYQSQQVKISSLSINGRREFSEQNIDHTDTLRLLHNENSINIEFACVNFTNPSSTYYSYMLEGINKSWSTPTTTRMLSFNQLPPGNYKLRLKAGAPLITETASEKILYIQIVPAWYQTIFFKWIVTVSSIILIVIVVRFLMILRFRNQLVYMKHQREIEQIRSRIARDIHDEIGAGLTKIKLAGRNLIRKNKSAGEIVESTEKITKTSDELIKNLSEIVWTINPQNDTLENIVAYVRIYLSGIFEDVNQIHLTANLPDPTEIPRGIIINPEVKRNLLLILKESLTNIFKHSNAHNVYVLFEITKGFITLKVEDDGVGLNPNSGNNTGSGLMNMRKRAEAIDASLSIKDNSPTGTSVLVKIPFGK